jgi:AraC-like DNA-binding protein
LLFLNHIPQPPLAQFVEMFWYYDGFAPREHTHERLMPDGSVEMVINLKEDVARIYDRDNLAKYDELPGTLICGPHSSFFVIDTEQQACVLGIHFKPGGAFPFFKFPADELHNQHIGLKDLWGSEAVFLRERLLAAQTPQEKFRVLEEGLLARAFKPLERHPAVAFALSMFGGVRCPRSVSDVSDQIGLSSRRFIQVFSDQVGLTPKLFCRVQRFQQVLKMLHTGQDHDWANVAAACGYYDQAHFIHDFKSFSGINPTTYAASKTEHMNHVPIR